MDPRFTKMVAAFGESFAPGLGVEFIEAAARALEFDPRLEASGQGVAASAIVWVVREVLKLRKAAADRAVRGEANEAARRDAAPRAYAFDDVGGAALDLLVEHEFDGGDVAGSPICPSCSAPGSARDEETGRRQGVHVPMPDGRPCPWGELVARARARDGAG